MKEKVLDDLITSKQITSYFYEEDYDKDTEYYYEKLIIEFPNGVKLTVSPELRRGLCERLSIE